MSGDNFLLYLKKNSHKDMRSEGRQPDNLAQKKSPELELLSGACV
jgi:hypothetical protein